MIMYVGVCIYKLPLLHIEEGFWVFVELTNLVKMI